MSQPKQSIADNEKSEIIHGETVSQSTANEFLSPPDDEGEAQMNKAKWLALFALGTAYMTAVQQGACIGMIVKSIDIALGTFEATVLLWHIF